MLDEFLTRKVQLLQSLGELCGLARRVGAQSLATRLEAEVVHKLEGDRFHLVVVGEFNHGKTALVNALLGREVLPVGVTPTTIAIHHLQYGETPAARAVRESGEVESIPFDRVGQFGMGGARAADPVRHLEIEYPAELLRELDISDDHVVLVNGKQMDLEFQLKESDKVVILPKIAGG